ncbi:MAG TPA: histidine kinase [Nocardioides bacterium]|nr:histidine kinase [Nocardioides sp.]
MRRAATWWFGSRETVEDRLFSWLAVLRIVLLVHAVALNVYRRDNFVHPMAGAVCLLLMAGWTFVAIWAYDEPRRRGPLLLVTDLAVAVAAIVVSPYVKGEGLSATVPAFWVMGALLAWAIHWHWLGGLVAGVCITAADLSVREHISQANYGNAFLLLLGGPIVGFMVESLQRMAAERDRAHRDAAAAAERARLARAVHDGVLQVLGLVQRRGHELGGEAAELGRLAGEQEVALRTLIREQDQVVAGPAGRTELATAMVHLGSRPGVEVVTTGSVELASPVAAEALAVVGACLDNVRRHVGPDARAWVLLEAWPDRVEISVRDEGPGIPKGRLDAAVREGRLGVSQSIRGRIEDLGGTARLTTGPDGTEWEFVLPVS